MDQNLLFIALVAFGVVLLLANIIRSSSSNNVLSLGSKKQGIKDLSAGPLSDAELLNTLRQLLSQKQKIEAIKVLRANRLNMGLKEAKDMIEELATSGILSLPATAEPAKILAAQPDEQVVSLLRQGLKIEAIKTLRESKNLGLQEAKAEVERIERQLGLQ